MNYRESLKNFSFRERTIPNYMHDSIAFYLENGVPPGEFLEGIITKNLDKCVAHADRTNIWLIPVYYAFFYTYAPQDSWGDQYVMEDWINRKLS